ncbi:hypothetical protein [Lacrimispora indolis]|uniref:hypothetical protein n=1 Tax=Lacrimispora indolis TaxID=69825 RepID=UPI000462C724|nr:hypothetical protein [[Clostridium] methoxybenzovorans]
MADTCPLFFDLCISKKTIEMPCQKCYNKYTKGATTPIQGVGRLNDRKFHPVTVQSIQGWFFYACSQDFIEKHYLQL